VLRITWQIVKVHSRAVHQLALVLVQVPYNKRRLVALEHLASQISQRRLHSEVRLLCLSCCSVTG